jgi:hypothetical protein
LVYTCTAKDTTDRGQGFIVVADQLPGQTEFEFFDREKWSHLGILKIKGVSNTDGIASFQKASPAYPWGIFVAVNNDRTTVGVG